MAYAKPDGESASSLRIQRILQNPSCIDCDALGREIVSVLQMLIGGSETISSKA